MAALEPDAVLGGAEALERESRLRCRYYEQEYPDAEQLVVVNVKNIAEMGAYVTLLEYDNIEGMILLSELSRRRIRSIPKLIRVGRNEVVMVLRVDKEKGGCCAPSRAAALPLPFAHVRAHAAVWQATLTCPSAACPPRTLCTPRSATTRQSRCGHGVSGARALAAPHAAAAAHAGLQQVHSILRYVASTQNVALKDLYERVGWPMYRKFGHAYEAFKLAVTCVPCAELCVSSVCPVLAPDPCSSGALCNPVRAPPRPGVQ